MDIKILDNKGVEAVVEPQTEKAPPASLEGDTSFLTDSIARMFDLKPTEIAQYKNKISTLIEYAKTKTDDRSPEGIKWAIRSLSLKVGTPPLGEKLINYLTTYAHIATEQAYLQKQILKFEKNP